MEALPWIVLNRRTVFQPALNASSAELVLGSCPMIPGDLAHPGDALDIPNLLKKLRMNAAKEPAPTRHNKTIPVNWPKSAQTCTHVWVRRGKSAPLGPPMKGPCEIIERLGDSTLLVQVGTYVDGRPRLETHTWRNCQPAVLSEEDTPASIPAGEMSSEQRQIQASPSVDDTTPQLRRSARILAKADS